jgi:hypothetical protein
MTIEISVSSVASLSSKAYKSRPSLADFETLYMKPYTKCEFASEKCMEKWVAILLVTWIVIISCSAILMGPFLKSLELPMTPAIVYDQLQLSQPTIIIICVWLLSCTIGICRPHEHVAFCIVDTVGMTWLVFYLLKASGNV